jgi:uncharacterized protein
MRRSFLSLMFLLPLSLMAGGSGRVAMKGHLFSAEVAVTQPEQAKGLMYRDNLPKDRCMFFLYDEDRQHPIWMKNCLISLDVVWLDYEGRVVGFEENVPPCSPMLGDNCPTYGDAYVARYFVEFPSGTFKRLGLKKGDQLAWDFTLDDGRNVKGGGAMPTSKPARKAPLKKK